MVQITLHNNRDLSATYVSNNFIDYYMTNANGEYVKIYLYLLRCINSIERTFSLSSVADKFEHTEKDIQRALKYWEKMNLLHLEYDAAENLSGIYFLDSQAPVDTSQTLVNPLTTPAETLMAQNNIPVQTTMVPHTALVPEQNGIPVQTFVAQNNTPAQTTVVPHTTLVPEQNGIPVQTFVAQNNTPAQTTVVPHTTLVPEQNGIPVQTFVAQNNTPAQTTVVPHTTLVPEQNSIPAQTTVIPNTALVSEQNGLPAQAFVNQNNMPTQAGANQIVTSEEISPHNYTATDLVAFQEQEVVQELLFVIEHYLKRPLTVTDVNIILFWYDQLELPVTLIEYLVEYCLGKGHSSLRYMEKVAIAWKKEGINTVEHAKSISASFNQTYFSVMRALGITGRNLIPSETALIDKWSNNYGFDMEIINEACRRTINAIQKPSLEYTDGILTNWQKQNVHQLSDIVKLDSDYNNTKKAIATNNKVAAPNKFHNFNQRTYDYEQLEQQLLNVNKN